MRTEERRVKERRGGEVRTTDYRGEERGQRRR